MRVLLLLIASLWAAANIPGYAQKTKVIKSVKGGVYTTEAGKVLVFNNYENRGLNFSLTFPRDAAVQASNRQGVYTVNGQFFQVLAVPIAPFKTDSATTTLGRYINSEANYLIRSLPKPVTPFARIGTDKQGLLCSIWGFPMPEGTNEQIAQQIFVNFIDGEFIISMGSTQLQGQDLNQPLQLLLAAAHAYTSSPTPIALPAAAK